MFIDQSLNNCGMYLNLECSFLRKLNKAERLGQKVNNKYEMTMIKVTSASALK